MTEFNYTKSDGTINTTIQTDLIGILQGSENCTIHTVNHIGSNIAASQKLFVNFQKLPTSKTTLTQFAIDNNLTLKALIIGPKVPPPAILLHSEA